MPLPPHTGSRLQGRGRAGNYLALDSNVNCKTVSLRVIIGSSDSAGAFRRQPAAATWTMWPETDRPTDRREEIN